MERDEKITKKIVFKVKLKFKQGRKRENHIGKSGVNGEEKGKKIDRSSRTEILHENSSTSTNKEKVMIKDNKIKKNGKLWKIGTW